MTNCMMKLNNQLWYISYSFLLILLFVTAPVYGQDEFIDENDNDNGEPVLEVSLPSKSGISKYYYVQPVNVILKNIDETDGLIELSLDVTSNPEEHQQVFSARFTESATVKRVGTRIRLAGEGQATVKAVAKTRSGKVITATGEIRLDKGVDYSDESSLTKRLPMNIKFLKGPVGTAKSRIVKKKKYTRQLINTIYHPMLPVTGKQKANRLLSLEIEYRDVLLGQVEFRDAISNDPYIDIYFTDRKSDVGLVKVQWKDISGNIYKPEKINVKK